MNRLACLLVVPAAAMATIAVGVLAPAPARAECVSSGGTTLCSQGDVRGGDTGAGPGSMNSGYNPYICGYDGYCGDWDWDVDVDLGPGRPGIGGPGGPGGPGIGGPGGRPGRGR